MKRFLNAAVVAGLLLSLCACVAQPKNAQQAILAVRVDYTAAVEAASTYGNPQFVPLCTDAAATKLCANPAVVKQIKVVKDVVKPVIDGAEQTVLDPNFDRSKGDAIVLSAQNALKALTSITEALNLKAPPKP